MMQRSRLVIIAHHTRVGFASAYPVSSTVNEEAHSLERSAQDPVLTRNGGRSNVRAATKTIRSGNSDRLHRRGAAVRRTVCDRSDRPARVDVAPLSARAR